MSHNQFSLSQIFRGANFAYILFWLILFAANLYLLYIADESVLPRIIGSAHSAADLQYYSYIYHHMMVCIGLGLPLLLMRRLKIAPQGLDLFKLGDWRFGAKWSLVFAIVFIIPTWLSSYDPQFLQEYPLAPKAFDNVLLFVIFMLSYFLYYLGWESFYRGFMTYGLIGIGARPLMALLIQVAISTIIHIGKPDLELIGAIIGGFIFGVITMRSGSLIWALLLHFFIGFINTIFCHMHQVV